MTLLLTNLYISLNITAVIMRSNNKPLKMNMTVCEQIIVDIHRKSTLSVIQNSSVKLLLY